MTKPVDDKDLANISGAGGPVDVAENDLTTPGGTTKQTPQPGDPQPHSDPETDANHDGGYVPGQG